MSIERFVDLAPVELATKDQQYRAIAATAAMAAALDKIHDAVRRGVVIDPEPLAAGLDLLLWEAARFSEMTADDLLAESVDGAS